MQLTFLGTGAGSPSRERNVSCLALRLPQRSEVWLFDCGEGTQHQLLRSDLRVSQISRIFITHLHGDHLYGLLGLLATLGLTGDPTRVDLYGPPGLDAFLANGLRSSHAALAYPVTVHTATEGTLFDDGEYAVRAAALEHRIPTFGYRVDEHERPGALDAERAAGLGVPFGPLFGRLKRGETVVLPDGRTVDGASLIGPTEPGRSLSYCTDTAYSERTAAFARGVDLLVHEATFVEREAELARASGHSTAGEAARVAAAAGAGRLVLTHVSPRYAAVGEIGPADLLAEARAVFARTELAEDFLVVEVPRHGGASAAGGRHTAG